MFIKPNATEAIRLFLSRGGTIKRLDTPTDEERVRAAMISKVNDEGEAVMSIFSTADQTDTND